MQTKRLMAVALTLLITLCTYFPVLAETVNNYKVMVNNTAITFNGSVDYNNGIVLVPAKEFIESLGGTFSMNGNLLTATARFAENELVFRLDDDIVSFNGKYIQAPAPMKIINNRYVIPAAFSAAKLGAECYMSTKRSALMVFQPQNGKLTYKVLPGDTLWIISQLFGTTIGSIKEKNGLTGDMLFIGQILTIKTLEPYISSMPAYTTAGATLRNGAGFDFSIAGYLAAWTNIEVTGKNGDWFRVTTPKGSGYIYYTVLGMKQELTPNSKQSIYFSNKIPVDTSMDTITFIDYIIQRGDYIWAIAQRYGIPDYELSAANNLASNAVLYLGQKIVIPVHDIPVKKTFSPQYGEVLDWYSEAQYVFPIGKTGRLVDVASGKSFMIKRTLGSAHSDTEVLTAEDAQIMKEIFDGRWSWSRKTFILEVDGRRIAVSAAGMPHGGVDGAPFLQNVDNRSDNYGYGPNYDAIAGNGMDGHFDLYFLNSVRHVDNKIDQAHQYNVLTAGGLQ